MKPLRILCISFLVSSHTVCMDVKDQLLLEESKKQTVLLQKILDALDALNDPQKIRLKHLQKGWIYEGSIEKVDKD